MTITKRKITLRALRKIEKCGGDCKHCDQCDIKCASGERMACYAFYCKIADAAGYSIYCNSLSELQRETIDHLKFELS